MKIIVDENIAYGKEAFSEFGDVFLYHGRKIDSSVLRDADVLICRSITKVNSKLLNNTAVKFVGTATIGTDHLDKEYLKKNKITFVNAPGCNSFAVAEYIITSLISAAVFKNTALKNKSVGIIGYGNIGSKVALFAKLLGMRTVINDPPLKNLSESNIFSSLKDTLGCDAVTFHVPLNKSGKHKTLHLLNKLNIQFIKNDAIILNASRGEVTDNFIVLNKLIANDKIFSVFDVWENEPNLNMDLLSKVDIATPHIAGYSFEGKVNGTVQIHKALSNFLNIKSKWKPDLPKVKNSTIDVNIEDSVENILHKITTSVYRQHKDDELLRKSLLLNLEERKIYFDSLRKNYRLRREFTNYTVKLSKRNCELETILKGLRFNVEY